MATGMSQRWERLRHEWRERLEPAEQATILAWASFTFTFAGLRGLTHWIRAGHGPTGGGIELSGKHFHHYNIGILLLSTVAAVGLRGSEQQRRHPAAAVAFGSANAMIVDELALLLDLKDVYWAADGRRERRRRARRHRYRRHGRRGHTVLGACPPCVAIRQLSWRAAQLKPWR